MKHRSGEKQNSSRMTSKVENGVQSEMSQTPGRNDQSDQKIRLTRPLYLNKSTQTDSYVFLETSIPVPFIAEESDLDDVVVSSLLAAPGTRKKLYEGKSTKLAVAQQTTPISSVLFDATSSPCLKGNCNFAHALQKGMNGVVWLGCKYRDKKKGTFCGYWVHARCHGFPKMSQHVVTLAKGFRCTKHLI